MPGTNAAFRDPQMSQADPVSIAELQQALASVREELTLVQLRLTEQAALLDAATDAILVRQLDDRVVYWNAGATRIFGYQANEALGRSATELGGRRQRPGGGSAPAARARRVCGELVQQRSDGREILTEAHWTLVRNAGGEPQSVLSISTDITDRRRLEQQYLRAQRLESDARRRHRPRPQQRSGADPDGHHVDPGQDRGSGGAPPARPPRSERQPRCLDRAPGPVLRARHRGGDHQRRCRGAGRRPRPHHARRSRARSRW